MGRLFEREHQKLYRSLVGAGFDRQTAGDAVAEAFAQLLRRHDEVRSPAAWVWTAAFRIGRGMAVSQVEPRPDPPDRGQAGPEPPSSMIEHLAQLSSLQRQALVLHHYAGFPTAEIAEIVGSTPAAVRVHLMRGRRRLKQVIQEAESHITEGAQKS